MRYRQKLMELWKEVIDKKPVADFETPGSFQVWTHK